MTLRRILGLTMITVAAGLFGFLACLLYGPDEHSGRFALMIGMPGALLAVAGTVVLLVGGEALVETTDSVKKPRVQSHFPKVPR
jgi:hypothetical protein